MKLVLLTTYFYPEVSSVTHLFSDLTDELASMGHAVTVVCNRPNRGLTDVQMEAYRNRTDETLPNGVRILRVGGTGRETGGLVRRGLRFLGQTLALYRAAKKLDADAILVNSMPPYLGLVGALLAKRGRKTCYILQDLFPDSIIAMGKLRETGLVTGLCRIIERISLEKNTGLITISEDMRTTLLDKGVAPERLFVIPNWADCATPPVPRGENRLFHELGLSSEGFYAVYAGALGLLQEPTILLDAAKRTAKTCPEMQYLIIGSGGLEEQLRARMEQEGLTNVRLIPAQPIERVPEVYGLGDICLVTLKAGLTKIAMPSKTWTAMAAGRTVLAAADAGSEFERRIHLAGGYTYRPGDEASLAGALEAVYASREELPGRNDAARDYIKTHLNKQNAARDYAHALQKISGCAGEKADA